MWFINIDHKGSNKWLAKAKDGPVILGLTDELETRWQATEVQLGDFIAISNKISAINRWDKQCAINR